MKLNQYKSNHARCIQTQSKVPDFTAICLSIFLSIFAFNFAHAAKVRDTAAGDAVTRAVRLLNQEAQTLSKLSLEISAGSIVEIATSNDRVMFRYVDSQQISSVRVCSGILPSLAKTKLDYWYPIRAENLNAAVASNTFVPATNPNYCSSDRNGFYRDLNSKISLQNRNWIVDQLELVASEQTANSISGSLEGRFRERFQLESISIQLLSFDQDSLRSSFSIDLRGYETISWALDRQFACKAIAQVELNSSVNSSGAPMTYPSVDVGSLVCMIRSK